MPHNDHLSKVSADGNRGRRGKTRLAKAAAHQTDDRDCHKPQPEAPEPCAKADDESTHWVPTYDRQRGKAGAVRQGAGELRATIREHLSAVTGLSDKMQSGRPKKPPVAKTSAGDHTAAEATAVDPPRPRAERKLEPSKRLAEKLTEGVTSDHQAPKAKPSGKRKGK